MAGSEVATARLPAGSTAALATLRELTESLTGAVRVLVVRGAGSDFLATTRSATMRRPSSQRANLEQPILRSLRRNDLISVAVLHGRATGVGLSLALACDLRIVADDAQLAFVANTGYRRLDVEALGCLHQLVGYAAALDLALTGRSFGGAEAHRAWVGDPLRVAWRSECRCRRVGRRLFGDAARRGQ